MRFLANFATGDSPVLIRQPAHGREAIGFRQASDDLSRERVSATRDGLQQLLRMIVQCATQFNGALDERVVGHEAVRPDRLNQFLFTDQPSGIFHQILERLIHLRAKLDLLVGLEQTTPSYIQLEFAELVG